MFCQTSYLEETNSTEEVLTMRFPNDRILPRILGPWYTSLSLKIYSVNFYILFSSKCADYSLENMPSVFGKISSSI